ncbi:MAG TPA: hypothetical protein VGM88_19190 [Kofleriaceae bacterium]
MPDHAAVRRILDRYLIEVVERFELCPWARTARVDGELSVAILDGEPGDDAWVTAAAELLGEPATRVAMVVAPDSELEPARLRALRDRVAARLPHAGVAEFHPQAALELASPARLVPFLRRAPDRLLQLVPLAILDAVRGAPPAAPRAQQAAILGGIAAAPKLPAAARIAAANHATAREHAAAIEAILDDIARDRAASYSASR